MRRYSTLYWRWTGEIKAVRTGRERRLSKEPFMKRQAVAIWRNTLWQDLRYGCRMFARNPGFTLAAVLSIALGAGVNVAMFSAADALLLRPLPVPRPGEIV